MTARFFFTYCFIFCVALIPCIDAAPVISEFMADNSSVLTDEDGDYSDWIEIKNPDSVSHDLSGWHLTDDSTQPTKWTFPAGVSIPAGGHVIVFASNKDRGVAGAELHTNFKLSAAGEYLALRHPGGAVVAHEFSPQYPQQLPDTSYGYEGSSTTLLEQGDTLSYLLPQDGALGTTWTAATFNDSTWTSILSQNNQVSSTAVPRTATKYTFSSASSTVTSTLEVADMPVLTGDGLQLSFNTSHSGSTVYSISLQSPSGTNLLITSNNSQARIVEVDLNQFNGESPNGTWTLSLTTSGGFFNSGSATLNLWSVKMNNENTEAAVSGIGYENNPTATVNYTSEIFTELPSGTGSAYVRQKFNVTDASQVAGLQLRMKYDDGFVAYLNGVKVAESNAPASPAWDSLATAGHLDADAIEYASFNISEHVGLLNSGGNNVLAVHMLNDSTSSSDFLMVPELIAVIDDGAPPEVGYIVNPSPEVINESEVFLGLLDDTTFAVGRGFYETPFTETVTATDPGATLIYTTDGSLPSLTNGTQVSPATPTSQAIASVPIPTTTILRAIAVRDNYLPTNVDTQTYMFTADVLTQDGNGLPAPPNSTSTWDYEMDPAVVSDPRFASLESDLLSLPILSVVMPEEELWEANGIYANPRELGSDWERGCSVEVLNPDGSPNYQVDGGLRMQGAGSRYRVIGKKSMRLAFRKQYGKSTFAHPLWGETGPQGIGTLVLRGSYFDSWTMHSDGSGDGITRSNALQIRTHFATESGRAMGLPTIASNWVHLYLNGQYWGIYNTHERPDAEFAELHLGGDEDEYNVLKHRPRGQSNGSSPEVVKGDLTQWDQLMGLMSQDASQTSVYNNILSYLEVDNFIDYILLNLWGGNSDWPHNNWYAIRHTPSNGPFMFYVWDPENYIFAPSTDRTGVNTNNSPGIIYDTLRSNTEFQIRFADHVRKHMFNNGALSTPVMQDRWQALSDTMQDPMNAESARWGDEFDPPGTPTFYNTFDHFLPQIAYRKDTYMPARHDTVIAQLRNRNLYPATDAPDFSQHGGLVASGYNLTISNPNAGGTIYYTTDGSDPRLEGGAISGTALTYNSSIPITADVTVKARILDSGDWSALNEADFRLAALASASTLVVSEFSYNPAPPSQAEIDAGYNDADDFEYLEIMNISAESIDLRNVEFVVGVTFDFASSPITTLAPGGRLVVAENSAAFEFRYGNTVPVAGQFGGKLSNGGELIILQDKGGTVIQQFTYEDNYPWPDSADGQGATLVLKRPTTNPNPDIGANWRSSAATGGTPGAGESVTPLPGLPLADADGNGRMDLIDYVINGPIIRGTTTVDNDEFLTLEFTQNVAAEDADAQVEYSENLTGWTTGSAAVKLVSETFNNDGTVTYVWRSLKSRALLPRQFMRVKVTER